MTAPGEPVVLLPSKSGWRRLEGFRRVLAAHTNGDVLSALREAEAEAAGGRIAAGFITYEAAPAFDAALATRDPGRLPPAWFAVFDRSVEAAPPRPPDADGAAEPAPPRWREALDEASYARKVAAIREAIARGETYQVNFTFPLEAPFEGGAFALFERLRNSQRGRHGVFIETDEFAVCSASPELFFDLDGDAIRCRPMKGTSPRGRWSAEDEARIVSLRRSEKNRAENLMIVDMVRNDLGRIAETGSVRTSSLFDIERYPTVLQMTSTIEARTKAPVVDIFRALFPSASITGAPKVRTTRIIAELEAGPRGVYCGAAGWLGPGRRAEFNVAIRTVQVDKRRRVATFGTGSGIVWDSDAHGEYAECLTKSAILEAAPVPDFHLLETLRFDVPGGWRFLEGHLGRLAASARYFGVPFDGTRIRAAQAAAVADARKPLRVRLLLDSAGAPAIETAPLPLPGFFDDRPSPMVPFMRAAISRATVDSADVFLCHKTTHRAAYERARAACPGVEEVLLVNERGELTEGTIGNLVLQIGDEFLTPPLNCGLLPGVFRGDLLGRGALREEVLSPHDLMRANAAYLVNSVRGWSRLAMRS